MRTKEGDLSFGRKLRLARRAKNLSLREVEERTLNVGFRIRKVEELSGVTISHLSNIERDRKDLTTGRLRALALLYGVSTDWLLDIPTRSEKSNRPQFP